MEPPPLPPCDRSESTGASSQSVPSAGLSSVEHKPKGESESDFGSFGSNSASSFASNVAVDDFQHYANATDGLLSLAARR